MYKTAANHLKRNASLPFCKMVISQRSLANCDHNDEVPGAQFLYLARERTPTEKIMHFSLHYPIVKRGFPGIVLLLCLILWESSCRGHMFSNYFFAFPEIVSAKINLCDHMSETFHHTGTAESRWCFLCSTLALGLGSGRGTHVWCSWECSGKMKHSASYLLFSSVSECCRSPVLSILIHHRM